MKSGFVALVGRPNAGKSTLLNRLVGQKLAIVSDKPQTTRNRITGVRNFPDGQVVFVDTPGVHRPLHRLNVRMVDAALEALREVDVVAAVVDASEPPGGGDRYRDGRSCKVRQAAGARAQQGRPAGEGDAAAADRALRPRVGFADIVPDLGADGRQRRSARAGAAVAPAGRRAALPDDYLTDQPERFFVAELVREQVLQHTHAELPFASAVVVDRFEEPRRRRAPAAVLHDPRRARIAEADRRRQGGAMIKAIGTAARARARALLRRARVSRSARQGPRRLARGRAHARRTRPPAGEETEARDMAETDLYRPVKQFLEAQGYVVKGEIGQCDVVAVRGDEGPVVVELKERLSLSLILQAVEPAHRLRSGLRGISNRQGPQRQLALTGEAAS